eukprot:4826771-Amphidinium_carterae.1
MASQARLARPAVEPKKRKRGGGAASSSSRATPLGRVYPMEVPQSMTVEVMVSCLPPNCLAWIDRLENRYRVRYPQIGDISRSWSLRGERE